MTSDALRRQLSEAAAALQKGDRRRAAVLCEAVLAAEPKEANALQLLGVIRTQDGNLSQAIELLERAQALQPNNAQLLNNLGIARRRAGLATEAALAFQNAIKLEPRLAPAHYNLGNVLRDLENLSEARSAFEHAIQLKPDYADAHAALASLCEAEHDLTQARTYAEHALSLDKMNAVAGLALARVDLREDRFDEAARQLDALLKTSKLTDTNRVIAHGLLGQAFDRLSRFDEAFSNFERANAIQLERYEKQTATTNSIFSRKTIDALTAFFENIDWPHTNKSDTEAPVFFVGFPRSGTTLIEQVLASHPVIATIEEKDALASALADILLSEVLSSKALDLSPEERQRRQLLYWRTATPHIKGNRRGLVIDKLPLNTILLGPAYPLFPSAKIIVALRDPRDVVLSCFQQTFDMNAAMFEFLSLEGAARYYDAVMRLFSLYRQKLPLSLHVIRYEDLLADFEAETRRLLDFLGVPWDEAVRGYRETAKKRLINTPSASQVLRPLYTSARGKWRNYRAELEPVLPLLEPWVAAFGYDPA